MTVDKRLLRERDKIRKSRPKFRRQESWRYKRLKKSWRKPIGIDNAMRHHRRGIPTIVRVGFRGPKAVRGLTRAGMEEVLVHNIDELEEVSSKTQVARIASSVGAKKKVAITNRADELGITIINRPEEALSFATISEISEELLQEEDKEKKKPEVKKARKKPQPSSGSLTAAELEELERIEAEIGKKKSKPKKEPSSTKSTTSKKSSKPSTPSKKSTSSSKKGSSSASVSKKSSSSKSSSPAKKSPSSSSAKKTTSSKKSSTTTKKATTAKK